jgi:hypothetical protein
MVLVAQQVAVEQLVCGSVPRLHSRKTLRQARVHASEQRLRRARAQHAVGSHETGRTQQRGRSRGLGDHAAGRRATARALRVENRRFHQLAHRLAPSRLAAQVRVLHQWSCIRTEALDSLAHQALVLTSGNIQAAQRIGHATGKRRDEAVRQLKL